MKLAFTKMHGLGNDFMIVNGMTQSFDLSREEIRKIADRHIGVGFDQLLLLEKKRNSDSDFHYRIFNADGNEVAQCGNGARCLCQYIVDKKLSEKTEMILETKNRKLIGKILSDGFVSVSLGMPSFDPDSLPFVTAQQQKRYILDVKGEEIVFNIVSMGNPHAVIIVPDVETAPVEAIGKFLQTHPAFPAGVNVGFMQILSPARIALRVYERGAGETLACGSGSAAAAVIGCRYHQLARNVAVNLQGGELFVDWQEDETVWLTGETTTVFEGCLV